MKARTIIIIFGIVVVLVIGKFYMDHTANQKALIEVESKKLQEEKERKALVEGELKTLQTSLEESNSNIVSMEKEMAKLNEKISQIESDKSKLSSRQAWLSSQIRKEKSKVDQAKTSIISILNSRLSTLLDHRIRKISTFGDDSSFAYYVGRRNYLSIEKNNVIRVERSIHYSSTGQYLQPIYQDKDNGNNRFLITVFSATLSDLNLEGSEIKDMNKLDQPGVSRSQRDETYVALTIPLDSKQNNVSVTKSIEYKGETFDKTSKSKSVEIYTTKVEEANEVLGLLRLLKDLS